MIICKGCGKRGLFLRVDEQGLCDDCKFRQTLKEIPHRQSGETSAENDKCPTPHMADAPQKSADLMVYGDTGYDTLTLTASSLLLHQGGSDKIVPLSQIVSFDIKEAKGPMRPGLITIAMAGAPDTMVKITSFLAVGAGNKILFPYAYESETRARDLAARIKNYSSNPQVHIEAKSDADELGKWKLLLDDGAITQAEYETKKHQILGT